MIVQQYKLSHSEPNGISYVITWLESWHKINDMVTLRGMNEVWTVIEKYPHKIDKSDIKTKWNVGGL